MTDNRTTELMPCPFCGGEAYTVNDGGRYWTVECHDCAAHTGLYATKDFAIAAWNARAERTCEFVDDSDSEPSPPKCSACGYDPGIYECAWYEDGTYGYERNYCPN